MGSVVSTSGNSPASFRNGILAALSPDERRRVQPSLAPAKLVPSQILYEAGEKVSTAYFIERGIAAIMADIPGRSAQVEVGLVGNEGMAGSVLLLGPEAVSINTIMMQTSGAAFRISAPALQRLMADIPRLKTSVAQNLETYLAEVSQAAACNAHHGLRERLANWLLMVHDRTEGDELTLTQGVIAAMLGVRRPGVTMALHSLGSAGLIRHGRNRIMIEDRNGLEAVACPCYQRMLGFLTNISSRSAETSAS